MRQTLTLSAIVGIAFATLAVASFAAMRDAGERSVKQRQELNASIDRMLAERLARRDEPEAFAQDAQAVAEAPAGTAVSHAASDGLGVTPRERPAHLGTAESEERKAAPAAQEREQVREAAAARMKTKRRAARVPLIRPERLIPDTFRTIRTMTFGLLR